MLAALPSRTRRKVSVSGVSCGEVGRIDVVDAVEPRRGQRVAGAVEVEVDARRCADGGGGGERKRGQADGGQGGASFHDFLLTKWCVRARPFIAVETCGGRAA